MMTTALAENGAHKIYIIGRREEKLNELVAKFPGYALPCFSMSSGLHATLCLTNAKQGVVGSTF